jgi:hypothetical protein
MYRKIIANNYLRHLQLSTLEITIALPTPGKCAAIGGICFVLEALGQTSFVPAR